MPEDRIAACSSRSGAATKADAVSCDGDGVDGRVDLVVREDGPSRVPGSTSAPNGRAGQPEPLDQLAAPTRRVRASSSPVVEAFVRSLASSPLSQ